MRGGVPVLRRPSSKPSRSSVGAQPDRRALAGAAAAELLARRCGWSRSGTCPLVRMTRARRGSPRPSAWRRRGTRWRRPASVSVRRSVAMSWRKKRFGAASSSSRTAAAYSWRSLWQRGLQTAGPLAPVEHAELDARPVGDSAHEAAEGVDLAHDLALPDAADGRVARHRAERVEAHRDEERAGAEAGGGVGGLGPGVPAADHDHVVGIGRVEHGADRGWALRIGPLTRRLHRILRELCPPRCGCRGGRGRSGRRAAAGRARARRATVAVPRRADVARSCHASRSKSADVARTGPAASISSCWLKSQS